MSAWVSRFVDGKAQHFPSDSPTGGQILEQLAAAGFVAPDTSASRTDRKRRQLRHVAKKTVLDNDGREDTAERAADAVTDLYGKRTKKCPQCSKQFPGRKNQQYCAVGCREAARRKARRSAAIAPEGAENVSGSSDSGSDINPRHKPLVEGGVAEPHGALEMAISGVTGAEPAS